MRSIVSVVALLLVVLFLVPSLASNAVSSTCGPDWTSFTCDYDNSRNNAGSTITSANLVAVLKHQQWFFPTNHPVTSTPIVSDGNVYFADWAANVYSVNITTGSANWSVI